MKNGPRLGMSFGGLTHASPGALRGSTFHTPIRVKNKKKRLWRLASFVVTMKH